MANIIRVCRESGIRPCLERGARRFKSCRPDIAPVGTKYRTLNRANTEYQRGSFEVPSLHDHKQSQWKAIYRLP